MSDRALLRAVVWCLVVTDDDDLDPLTNLRGLSAFSTRSIADQFTERLRRPHWEMAGNALRKARAVLAVDPARAERYVDLALRLPYDEFEGKFPAGIEAHLALYCLVTDAAEESEPDDPAWLDAAIDAMRASDPAAKAEMRVVLEIVDHDFKLSAAEQHKLRRAVAEVEPAPTLHDGDFPGELLKDRIMALLALCDRYDVALDEYYG